MNEKYKKWTPLFAGVAVILILLVSSIVISVNTDLPDTESGVTRILQDPNNYYGSNVNVSGDVEEIVGSRALIIDSPGAASENLLVINKNPLMPIGGSGEDDFFFQENDRVNISGEVRKFNIREIEELLGIDLVDSDFAHMEGQPVVIADSINLNR